MKFNHSKYKQNDAILYTSDHVQHLVAHAEDVKTVFLKSIIKKETLEFLNNLAYPYKDLYQIAEAYKNNEKFRSILLNSLK